MKAGTTELVFIVDRSTSMGSLRKETILGFNELVEEQKKLDKDVKVTLVLFSTGVDTIYSGISINEVPPMTEETYVPYGYTSLLDAVGGTIDRLGKRLSELAEDERPEQVLFVIITDGEENRSQSYKLHEVKEKITHQTDVYKWKFVFTAANIDAFAAADSIGVGKMNTMSFDSTSIGTQSMYKSVSRSVSNYVNTGKVVLDDPYDDKNN